MSRVFFREELEGVATFWRIYRRDGVTLGFTGHDRDLWFDGVRHRAAPGMVPSAIRRSADLAPDSAEVEGALAHDSIDGTDLAAGRFDGAAILIGAVDWENFDHATFYTGTFGQVSQDAGTFTAELQSAKAVLEDDLVPRTSPTCRARFCGPGCTLSAARFTHEARLVSVDPDAGRVGFDGSDNDAMPGGFVRWLDGPQARTTMRILDSGPEGLSLDSVIDPALAPGTRALLREGCDRRLATCAGRFANAINFQGEPFLPGNDFLASYPPPA